MARKSIALLLILFIGFSPVTSAFAACLESSHFENEHALSTSVTAGEPVMMLASEHGPKSDGHGDHGNVSCHTSSTCVFHLCGGLGVTGSIRVTAPLLSNQHPPPSQANFKGRVFAPELEPPIRIV